MTDSVFLKVDSATATNDFLPIYLDSFPDSERRPVPNLMRQIEDNDKFSFYGFYVNGSPVGFITTWEFDEFVYVEHLAIDSAHRGARYGSNIISRLQEVTLKPIILEVEILSEQGISADEQHVREARVRFYNHLGFNECHLPYQQPPYDSINLPAVPLMLMECNGHLLPDSYDLVRDSLYRYVYEVDI